MIALSRAIKTSLLYPPEGSIPREFRSNCWDRLESALDEHESLEFEITAHNILHDGDVAFSGPKSDSNLPALLHRDGLRKIRILRGISRDEFERLFQALLRGYSSTLGEDDIVNLLWEGDFDFVEYEAVDDMILSGGEIDPDKLAENLETNYSDLLDEDREKLRKCVEDESAQKQWTARDELEELEVGSEIARSLLENIESFVGEDEAEVQKVIERDQEEPIQFSAIDLLFDMALADRDSSGFNTTMDTIDTVFNRLFDQELFPLLVYIIKKLRNTTDALAATNKNRAERMRQSYHRSGDRIRISKLTDILNRTEDRNLDEVRSYLEELDASALSQLLWMLGELEHFASRKAVCEILESKGRQRPEIIAGSIFDSRWYVVRNTAIILGEIGTDSSVAPLKKACEHEDERVRSEAVDSLAKIGTEKANDAIRGRLYDESGKVRRIAVQHIGKSGYRPALEDLAQIVASRDFWDLNATEQKEFLHAYASLGGTYTIEPLTQMITKWTPFGGEPARVLKELAVGALSLIGDPAVEDLLRKWSQKSDERGKWARTALMRRSGRRREETE